MESFALTWTEILVSDEEAALLGRVADLDGGRGRRHPGVDPVAQLGHHDVGLDAGLAQLGYRHLAAAAGFEAMAPLQRPRKTTGWPFSFRDCILLTYFNVVPVSVPFCLFS